MAVSFTQYLLPDGRKKIITLSVADDVDALARKLIDKGYHFEIEILTTGQVAASVGDNDGDYVHDIGFNDNTVQQRMETMIRRAAEKLLGISCS